MKKLILVFAILALSAGSALAAPKFSLVGNINYMKPTFTPAQDGITPKEGMGLGGGLLVAFPMGKMDLELGGIYSPRKYVYSVTTPIALDINYSATGIEIPVMLRFRLNPTFNLGVGGYYWMAQGDISAEMLGQTTTQTYAEAGYKKADYGLKFGLGINAGAFVFNASYLMGMANVYDGLTTDGSIKFNGIQGQVGFRFGGSK